MTRKIRIEEKVLLENDRIADGIRSRLKEYGIPSFNFVSSPGSGKTSLLEKTIVALRDRIEIALVAGDIQTERDANRLIAAGARMVRPITTGGACHLDAGMVAGALEELDISSAQMLLIENVGNLVCPSSYDLGENLKVVLISVTEGDDKPLKYPGIFRKSSVMVINKIDLLEYCDFDMKLAKDNALKINGNLRIFETSCRTGEGLNEWFDWLSSFVAMK